MQKWEAIMPAADREIYEKGAFGRREPFGKSPALLIIDVVRSFVGSRPTDVLTAIEEYFTSCGVMGWEALPRIRKLLEAARRAHIPVVYTKGDPVTKTFCGDSVKGTTPETVARIHTTEIPEEIQPLPSEFVYRKTKASAFFASPLPTYFHRQKVDSLLIAGTSTSGCIRASVVDAISYGYSVFLVEECLFDRSEFSHLVNLFEMNAKYATVIQLEEALQYLEKVKGEGVL